MDPMKTKNVGRQEVIPYMSLNDNMSFQGRELHVQTENVQSSPPCIRTHVFSRGRIIHTKTFAFDSDVKDWNDFGKIRDMMQKQHRNVIEKIAQQQSKIQNTP